MQNLATRSSYSPLFITLHDETTPTGSDIAGTHHSILRAVIFTQPSPYLKNTRLASFLDVAVIWDRDHDERVIRVLESLYLLGGLTPVKAIRERKGILYVFLEPAEAADLDRGHFHSLLTTICKNQPDVWPVQVMDLTKRELDTVFRPGEVSYLLHVNTHWELGQKGALSPIYPQEFLSTESAEREPVG